MNLKILNWHPYKQANNKESGFTQHHLVKAKILHKNGAGFTMIELVVVVSIITLLSLVSIPILASYQKTTKLRNEARGLIIDLKLAQQRSITEQNIFNLELDNVNHQYQIINQNTATVVKTIIFSEEVSIDSITSLTDDTVQFNPTGAVLESGVITLINTKDQTVTIEIKPSGYVEISEQL